MELNEYQEKAKSTAQYPAVDITIEDRVFPGDFLYPLLGLAEESGELVGKLAKIIRNKKGVMDDTDKILIAKELGDILWMLSIVSSEFGFSLEEIAKMNIEKLADRKARGVINSSGDNR